MPAPSPRDLELVRDAVSHHHEFVYRVAYRFLRNSADAEDVTQAVFLRLLQTVGSFATAEHPRAWLARAAIHRAMDWRRMEERRRQRENVWADRAAERKKDLEEPMNLQEVEDAISSLPDELRVPVVLHYREGLKYREIAEVCDCPEGTVARRISLAKTRLRRRIQVGGAAAAALSVDSALRASEEVQAPGQLADRIVAAVEKRFGELSGPLPAGPALAGTGSSVAIALGIAVVLLPVGWIALERAASSRRGNAPAVVSAETAPADLPRAPDGALERGPIARSPEAAPGAASATEPAPEDPAGESAAEPATSKPPIVVGWVHDDRGRPIEGAKVDLLSGSTSCSSCHTEGARAGGAVTDAAGYYEIAPAGGASMGDSLFRMALEDRKLGLSGAQVQSGGMAPPALVEWIQPAPASVDDVVARKLAELDVQKMKLAEATARLERKQLEYTRAYGVLDRQVASAGEWNAVVTAETALVEADAIKYFYSSAVSFAASRSSCLLSGQEGGPPELHVAAHAPGFEAESSEPFGLLEGQSQRVDLVLRESLPLAGIVLDPSGAPVAGASVSVIAHGAIRRGAPGAPLPAGAASATSGEDGGFAFDSLPRGVYALRATAPGQPASVEAVGVTGGPAVVLSFPLTGSLLVEVGREATGEPASGYRVEARKGSWLAAEGVTDESGHVRLEGLLPGDCLLNTFHENSGSRQSRARATTSVAGGEEVPVRLDVASKVRVDGIVEGTLPLRDGEQLNVLAVPLRPEPGIAGQPKAAGVLENGSFSFSGLAPGKYAFFVKRCAESSTQVVACALQEVVTGASPAVRIEIPSGAPGRFAVALEDAAGAPIPGAIARVFWAGTRELAGEAVAGRGRMSIEAPAGRFDVEASVPGLEPGRLENLALAPGETKEVRIAPGAASLPAEPAADLQGLLGGAGSVTLLDSVRLGTLLGLIESSGGAGIETSPEALLGGALDHAKVEGAGVAADLLEAALEPAGLRAVDRRGRATLVPR